MLSIFAVQLPFSVCAVWFFLVLIKGKKTHSDHLIMWVMALLAISFMCGSFHMDPNPKYIRLVFSDLVMQFATTAVFPVICYYIRSLYEESRESGTAYLLMLPSLLLLVSDIVVTALLGIDDCAGLIYRIQNGVVVQGSLDVYEHSYLIMTYIVYHVLFFISLTGSLIYVFSRLFAGKFKFIHIPDFLRGQKSSFVANVLCLFFVIFFVQWGVCVLFRSIFMDSLSIWSSLWSIVTSFILFLVGYVAAIPPLPGGYINMDRMRHPFNAMRQSRQEFLQSIHSGPVAGASASGYDKIMESFKKVMVTDQGFLEPTMTIDEISQRLNTNRTYVSKLVNIYYGMPFRDYLNQLRLDYSKQLMTDEPDAVIDYIATKSGFQSSTQFIRKFRETEGVTPTVWKNAQRSK